MGSGSSAVLDGRPAGYRSLRISSSSFFSEVKGVSGSEKRKTVCLPCLKRRVQAVASTPSPGYRTELAGHSVCG